MGVAEDVEIAGKGRWVWESRAEAGSAATPPTAGVRWEGVGLCVVSVGFISHSLGLLDIVILGRLVSCSIGFN